MPVVCHGIRFVVQADARPPQLLSPQNIFPSVERQVLLERELFRELRLDADLAGVGVEVLARFGDEVVLVRFDVRVAELPTARLQPFHHGRHLARRVPRREAQDGGVLLADFLQPVVCFQVGLACPRRQQDVVPDEQDERGLCHRDSFVPRHALLALRHLRELHGDRPLPFLHQCLRRVVMPVADHDNLQPILHRLALQIFQATAKELCPFVGGDDDGKGFHG